MSEPAIVAFGRHCQRELMDTGTEYRAALVRAFKDRRADYIVLDSIRTGQRFVAAGVAWGIDHGLLYHHHDNTGDEQCAVSIFRLTEEGKADILL